MEDITPFSTDLYWSGPMSFAWAEAVFCWTEGNPAFAVDDEGLAGAPELRFPTGCSSFPCHPADEVKRVEMKVASAMMHRARMASFPVVKKVAVCDRRGLWVGGWEAAS
jgi:hypothetical protein